MTTQSTEHNHDHDLKGPGYAKAMVAQPPSIESMIDILRREEGSSLTIFCQNPEGSGPDNEAITVSAGWTDWEDRRFTGTTLRECLAAALAAMPEHCKPGVVMATVQFKKFFAEQDSKGGTFIPLDGPLPDFVQGPPISRISVPPVEAANIMPPGGNTRTVTRGGEIEWLVVLDASGKIVRRIDIDSASPFEIMEVYAHLKFVLEQAAIDFRQFGAVAAKAHASTPCNHPKRIEHTLQGVFVTGKFYCPDCGLVFTP